MVISVGDAGTRRRARRRVAQDAPEDGLVPAATARPRRWAHLHGPVGTMPDPMPPLSLVLAHGASGNATSMRQHVDGLRTRGISARAIDLPKSSAERAVAVFADQIARERGAHVVIGGHSYGGRVASMLASRQSVGGLVLLSYPVHRPGHPEELRVDHWPSIGCPVLLLSGESDPFARINVLRDQVSLLRDASLHTYPGIGHGLALVLDDALDRVAEFMRSLSGAAALPGS